jgi:ATP:ADP antiporter, AAA family
MSSKNSTEFSHWRSFLWPIHRYEIKKFVPLLILYALICFNYSLLKAAKDALVITAPGSGAIAIPFIKIWAILPMALRIENAVKKSLLYWAAEVCRKRRKEEGLSNY